MKPLTFRRFLPSLIVCLVLSIGLFSIPASAQSANDSPPSNFNSFKADIAKSLVAYKCGSESGVAFSSDWTISEDDLNSGINSNFFTSGILLGKCGQYDSTFDIIYGSKTYSGKIWNAGRGDPDFGGFSSSLRVTSRKKFEYNAPVVGSWVAVVKSIPGYDFTWSESTVRAYNSKTLIFSIDSKMLGTDKNALVFNNLGEFLGIVSTYGTQQSEGLVTVHGAPLQCPLNKTQTTKSITNCRVFAQDIWSTSNTTGVESDLSALLAFDAENATTDAADTAFDAANDAFQAASSALAAVMDLADQVSSLIDKIMELAKSVKKLR